MESLDGNVDKIYYNTVTFCLEVGAFTELVINEMFVIISVNQILTILLICQALATCDKSNKQ